MTRPSTGSQHPEVASKGSLNALPRNIRFLVVSQDSKSGITPDEGPIRQKANILQDVLPGSPVITVNPISSACSCLQSAVYAMVCAGILLPGNHLKLGQNRMAANLLKHLTHVCLVMSQVKHAV